jgi:CBS domain-containing protein
VAWFAEGLPGDGRVRDADRAGAAARRDVPTVDAGSTLRDVAAVVGDWEVVVVVDGEVVVGAVRAEAASGPGDTQVAAIMDTAPSTVRPNLTKRELAKNMDRDRKPRVLVTTLGGRLIGLVRREDLDG